MREESAAQFKGGQVIVGTQAIATPACPNAEERKAASARIGYELTRGVRNSVDLVKRVRKERDADQSSRSYEAHANVV